MKQRTLPLTLFLAFASSLARASGDGCDQWCGELPNAYFLAPLNDSRGNIGLLLEDLGILSYQPKSIPFHFGEFLAHESASQTPTSSELAGLATAMGIGGEAIEAAQKRQEIVHYGRCLTDSPQAVETFLRELKSASLPAQDALALAQERLRFAGLCEKSLENAQAIMVSSEPAKAYARYLDAAAAFYGGQYELALEGLDALASDTRPWLRETALYLKGRVALNQAQVRFDEASEPNDEQIDKAFLNQAQVAFGEYLKAFPEGRYAESAKGLFRKIHWLSGDQAALATDYQRWLSSLPDAKDRARSARDFIDETESKRNPVGGSARSLWPIPVLASANILASWRPSADNAAPDAAADKAEITTHAADTTAARLPALASYLELAHAYWVKKDYAAVIHDTDAEQATAQASNQAFSRWALRGLALTATGQFDQAETFWRGIVKMVAHPGQNKQAQWLLALNWNEAGRLENVYAKDSPVTDAEIQDFFVHAAPPDLLENLLQRTDLSLRVRSLAYFNLVSQRFRHREFQAVERILSTYPSGQYTLAQDKLAPLSWPGQRDGYACPPLKELLAAVQKTKDAPRGLNCLGDFLRTQGWDTAVAVVADQTFSEDSAHRWHALSDYGLPAKDRGDEAFGSKAYTSLDYYQEVIERRGKAPGDDVAYALHQATTCFASSGYNHCGDRDVPKTVRAAWFKRLKSEFKSSPWAQEQKYFW